MFLKQIKRQYVMGLILAKGPLKKMVILAFFLFKKKKKTENKLNKICLFKLKLIILSSNSMFFFIHFNFRLNI